ncbi:MAG TPA: DUF998 domain-containing protein [Chloroflexota bacterium]
MYDLLSKPAPPHARATSVSSARPQADRLVRIGGLCWAFSVVFFGAQVAAQAVFAPSYSLFDNRVSDLGNTTCGPWLTYPFACSPLHDVVNAAFVATGVLFVLGAMLTWNAWPRRRLTTAGLVCIALAGVGYMLVGLNPENVNVRLHILGASNLLTSNLALLLLGLSTRLEHSWRSNLAFSLAAVACVGLVGGPALLATVQHGGGLSERLVLYPCVIYLIVVGVWLLRNGCSRLPNHRAA